MLDKYLKPLSLAILRPLAHLFIRLGFRPDWLTLFGLVMNMGATVVFAKGELRWGAVVMMVAGLCDILDGQVVERVGEKQSLARSLTLRPIDTLKSLFILGLAHTSSVEMNG